MVFIKTETLIPTVIVEYGIEKVILEDLRLDVSKMGRWLKGMITKKPSRNLSIQFKPNPYRAQLKSQSWRRECISVATALSIFGPKCSLVKDLIKKKTSKVTYIHVNSTARMNEIFTYGDSRLSEVKLDDGKIFNATAKVYGLIEGKKLYGYVLSESGEVLVCEMSNGRTFNLKRPLYSNTGYIFKNTNEYGWSWELFQPIVIRIAKNSMFNIHVTFNRVCHEESGAIKRTMSS